MVESGMTAEWSSALVEPPGVVDTEGVPDQLPAADDVWT
jgi:hypothetical protein